MPLDRQEKLYHFFLPALSGGFFALLAIVWAIPNVSLPVSVRMYYTETLTFAFAICLISVLVGYKTWPEKRKSPDTPITSLTVVTRTSDYAATLNDDVIRADSTLRPITIYLPPATNGGKVYEIYRMSTKNAVRVLPTGNDTIGKGQLLPPNESMNQALLSIRSQIKLTADGVDNWIVGPGFFLSH